MRHVPAALLLVLAAAAPARATDFTGFYAGINAGYAFGREGPAGSAARGPGPAATGAGIVPGPDLPPSAAQAARQMRAKSDGGRPPPR